MNIGTTGAFYATADDKGLAACVLEVLEDGDVVLVLLISRQTVKATPGDAAGDKIFVAS